MVLLKTGFTTANVHSAPLETCHLFFTKTDRTTLVPLKISSVVTQSSVIHLAVTLPPPAATAGLITRRKQSFDWRGALNICLKLLWFFRSLSHKKQVSGLIWHMIGCLNKRVRVRDVSVCELAVTAKKKDALSSTFPLHSLLIRNCSQKNVHSPYWGVQNVKVQKNKSVHRFTK